MSSTGLTGFSVDRAVGILLQGIKPASLANVKHLPVKEFIEKCLLPASERLSAKELLEDPFLQVETPKDQQQDPLQLPNQYLKELKLTKPLPTSMDIDTDYKQLSQSTLTGSNNESPECSALEFCRSYQDKEFRLKGKKNDENSISLTLRIADSFGKKALQVATENQTYFLCFIFSS